MANRTFQSYKQAIMTGTALDLESAALKFALCDSAEYAPDTTISGDEFLSDIPAGARVAITDALAGVSVVDAILDFDNPALPDTGGAQAEYLVLFDDTGVEATSRLIHLTDTATGLPITPDTVEDTIQVHAVGLFAL